MTQLFQAIANKQKWIVDVLVRNMFIAGLCREPVVHKSEWFSRHATLTSICSFERILCHSTVIVSVCVSSTICGSATFHMMPHDATCHLEGLLDRIYERKRAALVDLNGTADAPPRRRLRRGDPQENSEEKVSVQRFTLVSRGAPPVKRRQPAQHELLRVPPRDSASLGDEIHVCRCSDCDKHGVRRRLSGRRTCRRDTESHPEYCLLLNLTDRFEEECHRENADLVNEACCREKSAFFILGPGSTAVGYVAAEVAANRKVRGLQESDHDDRTPFVTQIYVEPEFRKQGYASQALCLLLRDHGEVKVDVLSSVLRPELLCISCLVADFAVIAPMDLWDQWNPRSSKKCQGTF